jgi:hypothetical protein
LKLETGLNAKNCREKVKIKAKALSKAKITTRKNMLEKFHSF